MFFLSVNENLPINNGSVLKISQIIKVVVTSEEEAEIESIYVNALEDAPLIKMGHPQPMTPMQIDNSAAHSVAMNNIHARRTKAVGMRFHWLKCQDAQGYFRYYCRPHEHNLVEFWSKHQPVSHNREKIYEVFTPTCQLELL